jgi:hypothetical protein
MFIKSVTSTSADLLLLLLISTSAAFFNFLPLDIAKSPHYLPPLIPHP